MHLKEWENKTNRLSLHTYLSMSQKLGLILYLAGLLSWSLVCSQNKPILRLKHRLWNWLAFWITGFLLNLFVNLFTWALNHRVLLTVHSCKATGLLEVLLMMLFTWTSHTGVTHPSRQQWYCRTACLAHPWCSGGQTFTAGRFLYLCSFFCDLDSWKPAWFSNSKIKMVSFNVEWKQSWGKTHSYSEATYSTVGEFIMCI